MERITIEQLQVRSRFILSSIKDCYIKASFGGHVQARPILESAKHKLRNGIKLTPEQVKHVQELSNVVTRTKKNMDTLMKELEQMKELLTVGSDAQIIVREKVYPGTKLVIADVSKIIKTLVQYCRFVKQQGDVTMIGMN